MEDVKQVPGVTNPQDEKDGAVDTESLQQAISQIDDYKRIFTVTDNDIVLANAIDRAEGYSEKLKHPSETNSDLPSAMYDVIIKDIEGLEKYYDTSINNCSIMELFDNYTPGSVSSERDQNSKAFGIIKIFRKARGLITYSEDLAANSKQVPLTRKALEKQKKFLETFSKAKAKGYTDAEIMTAFRLGKNILTDAENADKAKRKKDKTRAKQKAARKSKQRNR